MAFNMAAILRITAQTKGTQEVVALNDAVGKLGSEAQKTGQKLQESSEKGANWKAIASVAALTTGLTFATKSAVEFESGMADVRKVVDGLSEPAALKSVSSEIISLSQRLPIAAEGFASIYAAAGQSGIAKDQLKDFSLLVTNVATAFDFTAQEAGTSLAQIKTALTLSTPELGKLADAMNYVENNTGATARGLVEFMTRSASVGKIAGLNAVETLAFGAAMTQAGVETEVAATSFNNMVKALSKGPSMTERQVDALRRLGYGVINAAEAEKKLTEEAEKASESRVSRAKKEADETVRIAERQAEERLRVARGETNDLLGEIEERYRKQRQMQSDNWEDSDIQAQRAREKILDQQIQSLERQGREEIEAERERQRLANVSDENALDRIRKYYDNRADEIRQSAEDEARLEERRRRDSREAAEKEIRLKEQAEKKVAEAKLAAIEENENKYIEATREKQKERIAAVEKQESEALKKTKEQAKKRGEELATNFSQGFSDRLQKDAVGTIGEVLERINDLPKSQQISVLSDLFGDEARGLAPLLSNLDELKRILALVAKEQEYLGSTSDEAAVRFTTSASKLQVFNNNMTALKIAVGETLLPLLLGIIQPIQSIVAGLTAVTNAGKEFIAGVIERTVLLTVFSKAIVGITGVAISLGVALGGIMSLVTLTRWAGGIKLLAMMPGPLRLVAIALAAIGVSATPLGPIISAIGTALFAIQAIKFGASVVQGVSAMMPALTGLLAWMTGTFLPTMVGIFTGPVGWIALGVAAVVAGMVFFREPIIDFFGWAYEQVAGFWKAVFGFIYDTQLKPWVDLWNNVLSKPITDTVKNWLSGITKFFGGILDFIDKTWLKQWAAYWEQFTQDPFAFIKKVQRGFDDLGASVMDAWKKIPGILQSVWDSVLNGMGRTWRWMIGGAIDALNGIIQLWNSVSANVNKMPTPFKLPVIPEIQRAQIPGFARGAFIDKPTLGWVGEGRNPREYIIPEGGMDAAAVGWQQGLRGDALAAAWQSPGLAPGRTLMEPSSGGMGGQVAIPEVKIQISQTGNTLQMPDGSQWVSRDEAMALVAHGSRLTLDAVARLNRSAAGRSAGRA